MSSATITRPSPRSRSTPRTRPPVRPVAAPASAPARAPFIIVVLVLLTVGLGTLLLLNTLLAQGSFTLHSVNAQVASLADREQALQQRASELAAPQRLARSAQALGMVPSQNPAFLRSEDGKVLGVPEPAPEPVVVSPVIGSETAEPVGVPSPEDAEAGDTQGNGEQRDANNDASQGSGNEQSNVQANQEGNGQANQQGNGQGDGGADQ